MFFTSSLIKTACLSVHYTILLVFVISILRCGADKFLAQPGRNKATATKLWIYSTYSPRSSIHFLARCSNFYKPQKKKKIQKFARPTRSTRQQWPRRTKNGDLSIVFSIQGTCGSEFLINNLRSGHCFGSSRTRHITSGKITTFKLGHTIFDSGIRWCMFPYFFSQNGVNFLRGLALREEKKSFW